MNVEPADAMLTSLWQDLRFALRNLRRTPGFTAAAVLTLALGIGASTSVFSVAYGVLLAPLPFRDPSHLYVLHANNPTGEPSHFPLSGEEYKAFAREQKDAAQMGAYFYYGATEALRPLCRHDGASVRRRDGHGPPLRCARRAPQAGRLLRPDDDISGSPWVVVASDGFWRRAFGGEPVDRRRERSPSTVAPTTIVGVAPRGTRRCRPAGPLAVLGVPHARRHARAHSSTSSPGSIAARRSASSRRRSAHSFAADRAALRPRTAASEYSHAGRTAH